MSGGEKKLDGIFEIIVGTSDVFAGKISNTNTDPKKGIITKLDPQEYILGTNKESFLFMPSLFLRSYYGTDLSYDSFESSFNHEPGLSKTTVYVHVKKDTEMVTQFFDFARIGSTSRNYATKLFSKADSGKTYRMYIGPLDTPPRGSKSLFFKQLFNLLEGCLDVQQGFTFHQRRINCRCHRYCRYLSRWGNRIRQIVRTSFTGGNQSHQTSDWRRNYGFVSGLCNIGRIIYNGSIRQYLFQRYETFSHRVPDGRNVSTLWRFVLSLCASHTMGGAYA